MTEQLIITNKKAKESQNENQHTHLSLPCRLHNVLQGIEEGETAMNCKETTRLDTSDIETGFDDIGGGLAPRPPYRPAPPLPDPYDGRTEWLVSEGCVGVALLSLATTIISLILLKGK